MLDQIRDAAAEVAGSVHSPGKADKPSSKPAETPLGELCRGRTAVVLVQKGSGNVIAGKAKWYRRGYLKLTDATINGKDVPWVLVDNQTISYISPLVADPPDPPDAPTEPQSFSYILDEVPEWWKRLNGTIDVATAIVTLPDGTRIEPGDRVVRHPESDGLRIRVFPSEAGRKLAQQILAKAITNAFNFNKDSERQGEDVARDGAGS